MKKFVLTLGTAALLAVPALAETAIEDADGNGTWSYEEMTAAYADLTEDQFNEIDADKSGEIDADELAAAREAGTIAE